MAATNSIFNRWVPLFFTMVFILHPDSVLATTLATEEFTVNPFSQQALRQLNWRNFPTNQQLKHFKVYSGENQPELEWKFIYEREFRSEFSKTAEYIQEKGTNGNKIFRLNIALGLDDTVPQKCDKAREKIERAIGEAVVYVDTSYTSKVLVSQEPEATFDWHTIVINAQWIVGNTLLEYLCLGFGANPAAASSQSALVLIIEEKERAEVLKPILWLVCSTQSTLTLNDGSRRQQGEQEFVFGIDFNKNSVLRADNSRIDNAATVTESSIEFKYVKDENSLNFQINRYTGSITGETQIKSGSVSAIGKWNGDCVKLDKAKKKF